MDECRNFISVIARFLSLCHRLINHFKTGKLNEVRQHCVSFTFDLLWPCGRIIFSHSQPREMGKNPVVSLILQWNWTAFGSSALWFQ